MSKQSLRSMELSDRLLTVRRCTRSPSNILAACAPLVLAACSASMAEPPAGVAELKPIYVVTGDLDHGMWELDLTLLPGAAMGTGLSGGYLQVSVVDLRPKMGVLDTVSDRGWNLVEFPPVLRYPLEGGDVISVEAITGSWATVTSAADIRLIVNGQVQPIQSL